MITERGFIKVDVIILLIFCGLMVFLFYAGANSVSLVGGGDTSYLGELTVESENVLPEQSVETRLQPVGQLAISPDAASGDASASAVQIAALKSKIAELNRQLAQLDPATAMSMAMLKNRPQPQSQPQPVKVVERVVEKVVTKPCDCQAKGQPVVADCPSAASLVVAERPAEPVAPSQEELAAPRAEAVEEVVIDTVATPVAMAPLKLAPGKVADLGQLRDRGWLLAQQERKFSLQILAVDTPQQLLEEVNQSGLNPMELSYYLRASNGKIWYALMYGLFDNRAQALAAVRELPKGIRINKPWPRRLKEVHKVIRSTPLEATLAQQ